VVAPAALLAAAQVESPADAAVQAASLADAAV
jgi:hypothetical protein